MGSIANQVIPIKATIRRAPNLSKPKAEPELGPAPVGLQDALGNLGTQSHLRMQDAAAPTQSTVSPVDQVSQAVESTAPPVVVNQDSIAGTITYGSVLTQIATAPFFGETTGTYNVSNIVVTPGAGVFTVTANLNNPINWGVAAGGRTDIASETSAAITAANYASVAADLTPNMSDLGGRPPRASFWASDLTTRHELFHASDLQSHSRTGTTNAQTWLNAQTAASAADVTTLVNTLPGQVRAHVVTNFLPQAEQRAYGDGAASYQARAAAITRRGAAGGYP